MATVQAILFLLAAAGATAEVRGVATLSRQVLKREKENLAFNCSHSVLEAAGRRLSLACLDLLSTEDFHLQTFQHSSRGLCEDCGTPLYLLASQCLEDDRLSKMLDLLCATNDNGDLCYEAMASSLGGQEEMFAECDGSTCSQTCREDLQISGQQYGCCLFSSLAVLRGLPRARAIWSSCELALPSLCTGAHSTLPVLGATSSRANTLVTSVTVLALSFVISLCSSYL